MPGDGGPLIAIRGLNKAYATPALTDVSLDLEPGEVHALVGENGAGKSTLARILAGLTPPDSGAIRLRGTPYHPRGKADAEDLGVRFVPQELNLIGNLTIAENVFLRHLPHRWGWIDRRRLEAEAGRLLGEVGLGDLDPATPVRELGVGRQQLVEIAAGLSRRCALLILDEPTAALTDPEIEHLFGHIRRLQREGTAILYISHRLEEVRRISDRISVLRDGQLAASRPTREFPGDSVVQHMVGRELKEAFRRTSPPPGSVALEVRKLCRPPAVRDVSFTLHRGEILGLAGLMGSGRTETVRAVCGADLPRSGSIHLHGDSRPVRWRSPSDAVRHGLALLTEDRKGQGLLLPWPIRSNISFPALSRFQRLGWIRTAAEARAAADWIDRLRIRCVSPEQRVVTLSGGNQQKVVIAKWLLRDCEVLIFDEPTRGIDVGARFEIHQLLDRLTAQGKAILVVSSDLEELLALCDRIAVMSAGRIAGTYRRGEWNREMIMGAALSGYERARAALQ